MGVGVLLDRALERRVDAGPREQRLELLRLV